MSGAVAEPFSCASFMFCASAVARVDSTTAHIAPDKAAVAGRTGRAATREGRTQQPLFHLPPDFQCWPAWSRDACDHPFRAGFVSDSNEGDADADRPSASAVTRFQTVFYTDVQGKSRCRMKHACQFRARELSQA